MIQKHLLLILAIVLSSAQSWAKEEVLPYLGPGSDKLSKEEYERIYKNYIRTSILLGYPFLESTPKACDQALDSVFRQAGFFSYPVPPEAQQLQRSTRAVGKTKVETYESAGMLVQLIRAGNGAPERLIWINSSSPKASRRLSQLVKKEVLTLEKDPVTGLERVKGIPVGYPHPFLNASGQGLFVKILRFNGSKDNCQPLEFLDNAWQSGYDLSNQRCLELKSDAARVWASELSPAEFRNRELERMKGRALKNAAAQGVSQAEAKRLVDKHFVPPYTNEINVVGSAMRNLAQCNLLAMGEKDRVVPKNKEKPSLSSPKAGSAK